MSINSQLHSLGLKIRNNHLLREDGKELTQSDGEKAAPLLAKEILSLSKKEPLAELRKEGVVKIARNLNQDLHTHFLELDEAAKECHLYILQPDKSLYRSPQREGHESMSEALQDKMQEGKLRKFGEARPARAENISSPEGEAMPFPDTSLTRMLTGDVPPQALIGLGRMTPRKTTKGKPQRRLKPNEGYKDVFVSSLGEYQKRGFNFDPNNPKKVNIAGFAQALDLKEADTDRINKNGVWLLTMHPASALAIPTHRQSEWFPHFQEGGFTESGSQEWVTPNVPLAEELLAGRAKLFKFSPQGDVIEWKFFDGKLYPKPEWEEQIRITVEEKRPLHDRKNVT